MKKYIIILSIISIFNACTDVIDVDVPNTGKRLVVEASIDWKKGTDGKVQTIKLRTSTPYFDNNKQTGVEGAKIEVFNENNGDKFEFNPTSKGNYICRNFIPKLNNIYRLRIEYNGKTYQATEQMVGVSDIKEISQEKYEVLNKEITKINVFYDDPKGMQNYYLSTLNNENIPLTAQVRDDRFSDGNTNKMLYTSEDFKKNAKAVIRLYGVSKHYFNYMRLLLARVGTQGGSPFQSAPAKMYGNCKNINNPNEDVLGYFRLCQFSETTYIIK